MRISRRLVVALLFLLLVAGAPAQDNDNSIAEQDSRITGVEERQQAVTTLLSKVAELRKSGQLIEAARTLNRVGDFQSRMSLLEDAVHTLKEALRLLEQQPDPKTQVDSLNGLASSYDHLSKCTLAESHANQAIALSKQSNYVAGHARALITLSDCQNYRDHSLAVKSAQEALELWRTINGKRGMAVAYEVIAHYEMAQENLSESQNSLEAALNLFRELNEEQKVAEILIYFGLLEYRRGAWQNALTYYTQAQSMIDDKAEPYKMGAIAFSMGEAFLESGLPEVALTKFHEALERFTTAKNQRGITAANWTIGKAQLSFGQYPEALQSLQKARNDAAANGDVTLTAFCDDFLGRAYYSSNEPAQALEHFQLAFDGYTAAKNQMEAARTKALIAQVYEHQGKNSQANEFYQTALATFRRLSDDVNGSATLYALGRLELVNGHLDIAENYLRESIEITEKMRRVSTSSDLTAAFSATVHNRYQSYVECLMRKDQFRPGEGHSVRAFESNELARGRSLLELLRATQANLMPGIDSQLAEQEKSLRQLLRVKEDYKVTLLGRQYKREELEALTTELSDLETKYKEVIETIRTRYPSYDQLSRPSAWNLRQIQQQVIADDQTVLVEYSLGADHSYVWVVTRNSIKSYELPTRARISETAQRVYQLLSTPGVGQSENGLTQAAQELSQMVLLPVAAELNKQRLIVVADGALNYIPFQFLPAPNAAGEPLLANYEVINVPSASILGQLRRETVQRQAPTRTLAAFGDPVFVSNYAQRKDADTNEYVATLHMSENERWQHALRDIEPAGDVIDPSTIQPLFYSKLELANLRDLAGPESFVATGFDATRENLTNVDLTKYAILHFATHGVLDPKRPENSGLFLSMVDRQGKSQNGFVGLQDIYGLKAPVDLVVLSACRTGLGKDVRGEGLVGLTRGFMYAGASSVMASLWKVDDEATSELMKRFYTNMLQHDMTPSAALRAAQNSIRQEPQWRSPYFWAAFTLQGEYQHVIRPASRSTSRTRVLIILGLSLLLLLAGAAWWKVRSRGDKQKNGGAILQ